jgi:hypothetical protein
MPCTGLVEYWPSHSCCLCYFPEKVHVKCNQTGKIFKAKITALSKENAEPIVSSSDLAEGNELFLDISNKSYPVTVIKVVKDDSKPSKLTPSEKSFPAVLFYVMHLGSKKKRTDESSSKLPEPLTSQPPAEVPSNPKILTRVLETAKHSVSVILQFAYMVYAVHFKYTPKIMATLANSSLYYLA